MIRNWKKCSDLSQSCWKMAPENRRFFYHASPKIPVIRESRHFAPKSYDEKFGKGYDEISDGNNQIQKL